LKEINVKDRLIKEPEGILEDAIQGMVPKGPLGRSVLRKLFVYKGQGKDHSAQKPEVINL
jgi:large subunit ribosomal protein L13